MGIRLGIISGTWLIGLGVGGSCPEGPVRQRVRLGGSANA